MTTGGINDYLIDPDGFNKLIKLFSSKTDVQIRKLFSGLLTNRELTDITRRILISEMIIGGHTYKEMNKKIRSGQATISLVRQSLLANEGILQKLIEQTFDLTPVDKYIKRRLKKGK